jgi:hypothetical protein
MKISAECNICTPLMHKLQIHFAIVTAIDANARIQRGVIYTRRQQQSPLYLPVVGSLRAFLQQIKRRGLPIYKIKRSRAHPSANASICV